MDRPASRVMHWDALTLTPHQAIRLSPHGVKCIGALPPIITGTGGGPGSSFKSASLLRPGVTVLGNASPVGDAALDGDGVFRRWLTYGTRLTQTMDLAYFDAEWLSNGQPYPANTGTTSEQLTSITFNRWTGGLDSRFVGTSQGSGQVWFNPDDGLPAGLSFENKVVTNSFSDTGNLLLRQTITFDAYWDPGTGKLSVPITGTFDLFWNDELTLDAVIAEVGGMYSVLPELANGGPSYSVTKNASGRIVNGGVLQVAFANYPAGMGLYYNRSASSDKISKCGAILYIEAESLNKTTKTFDITGELTSTTVAHTFNASHYYPIEAGEWEAATINAAA
jgi:hypothetical protein